MASELEVLKQRIIELEAKNAELGAEKAELLKRIMEENTRRDIITFTNQKFLWISEDFDAEDLKSTNISQSVTLISPKSTFPNLDDSGNSLAFSRFTPIPPRYLELLDSEIFCETAPLDSTTSELWKKFGEWAGFEKFHRDLKDHRNTLCVVCPLGTFEGGHLAFPEIKLSFKSLYSGLVYLVHIHEQFIIYISLRFRACETRVTS
ncbi:4053_t:CDS:2 [Acaulospora colombiana]|uniref:4053_t:CDS:1 n=1 Tax=Acaulospora colombiana TaxID=27376 RepID=A0ACA9L847_9GLOM|nr:4053_t:CDS:2 [Acaulospora colombiana]